MIRPSRSSGANTADRVPTPRRCRRGGSAATDRAARRRTGRCAGSATRSPKVCRNSDATAGVSAISGTSISTRAPGAADVSRQPQVDLGLAAAGHAVQQRDAERPVAASARSRSSAPTCSSVSRRAGVGWRRHERRRFERIALDALLPEATRPCLARRASTSAPTPRAARRGRGHAVGRPGRISSASRCLRVSFSHRQPAAAGPRGRRLTRQAPARPR